MHRMLALMIALLCLGSARAADNELSAEEKAAGWELLFDGSTLGKWRHLNGWTTDELTAREQALQNGTLNPHMGTSPYDYMMIYNEELGDFILTLDLKTEGNSGVFLRTSPLQPSPKKDIGYHGIEMAVDATSGTGFTVLGAFYDMVKPTKNMLRQGDWNHVIITNHDNLLTVTVNGELTTVMNLNAWEQPGKRADGTPHKFGEDKVFKDHPRKGYIGLQDHGANCWYKNIKLLKLEPNDNKR